MRKALALLVVLGLVVVFGGMALAGEFGTCNYQSHAKQVMADKADAPKPAATKSTLQADSNKLVLAQTDKETPSGPEKKK